MSNWTSSDTNESCSLPYYYISEYTEWTVTYTPGYEMPRPPKQYKKHGHPRRRIAFPYTPPRKEFPRYTRSKTRYKRGK